MIMVAERKRVSRLGI